MLRFAGAVAGALLLSGCITASPPPAALSDSDRLDFARQEQELQWFLADLGGERPLVAPVFITQEEYGSLLNDCLDDRGLGEVVVYADGFLGLPATPLAPDERLDLYFCSATYIVSPDEVGYLSTEERERVYDYFRRWLVPCIEANGLTIPLSPSRDQFAATPGYMDWTPYYPIETTVDRASLNEVLSRCPYVPPGIY